MPEWRSIRLPKDARVRVEPTREFNEIRAKIRDDDRIRASLHDAIVKAAIDELDKHGIEISIDELKGISEIAIQGGEVGIVASTEGSSKSSSIWV